MIWDTHAHLDDPRYEEGVDEVVARAQAAGVERITNIGCDLPSSRRSVEIAQSHDNIYAAVGIHPQDIPGVSEADYEELKALARTPKVIGWGEIGLDYYRELPPRDEQKKAFIRQIELADQCRLPIIIHSRDAHQDVLDIVKKYPPQYGGVFHCYSGSWEMAKVLLNLGFYLSFAGPLTFKNNRQTVEVAAHVPTDRFLVETDSPYLTPEPRRGKRNEPAYVAEVVKRIAELKGLSAEETAELAWKNGERLFRLP